MAMTGCCETVAYVLTEDVGCSEGIDRAPVNGCDDEFLQQALDNEA